MCIPLPMLKTLRHILLSGLQPLLLAALLLAQPGLGARQLSSLGTTVGQAEGTALPLLLAVEAPELLALPAETDHAQLRTPGIFAQQSCKPCLPQGSTPTEIRQKQYLDLIATLLISREDHDIGFPFHTFW